MNPLLSNTTSKETNSTAPINTNAGARSLSGRNSLLSNRRSKLPLTQVDRDLILPYLPADFLSQISLSRPS